MDKYKKKAGGFVGSVTTPVQVKVTMVQPIKKGAKVTFVPINEVTLFLVVAGWFLGSLIIYHRIYGRLFLSLQT